MKEPLVGGAVRTHTSFINSSLGYGSEILSQKTTKSILFKDMLIGKDTKDLLLKIKREIIEEQNHNDIYIGLGSYLCKMLKPLCIYMFVYKLYVDLQIIVCSHIQFNIGGCRRRNGDLGLKRDFSGFLLYFFALPSFQYCISKSKSVNS